MNKKIRRIILIVIIVFLAVTPISTYAMSTRNSNISLTSISLSFDGSTANCTAALYAYSNTTSVSMQMTLYKKVNGVWVQQQSWSKTANSTYASMSQSATVASGTYKLTVVYTANGTVKEIITKSVERTK